MAASEVSGCYSLAELGANRGVCEWSAARIAMVTATSWGRLRGLQIYVCDERMLVRRPAADRNWPHMYGFWVVNDAVSERRRQCEAV